MKTEVETRTAAALDLLDPMQIVAWYVGSVGRGTRIRDEPHPRKHNAVARANAADLYETVLHSELVYELTKRDPRKARMVAHELERSANSAHHNFARTLLEHLDESSS